MWRVARFWDPPALDPSCVRVYGNDAFCLVLQQKLGLELCSPSDELIFDVPAQHLRRAIWRRTLGEMADLSYPTFCKPVTPKLFSARVYASAAELAAECRGLDGQTVVLASEPVAFAAEARCFVLEGAVLDCAIYEGDADAAAAAAAAADLLRDVRVPRAIVLDMGLIPGRGWALVELNAAWGAGLNGCRPELVWPCVAAASGPQPC